MSRKDRLPVSTQMHHYPRTLLSYVPHGVGYLLSTTLNRASPFLRLPNRYPISLNDVQADLEVLAGYGLSGLRRHRILRLTKQAYDQDALLSYEDLAVLLTTSPATVKRDIRQLKQDGYFVMTRGAKHDMGPGMSHKTQILQLYFKGYQFTEIEQKTNHTERAVWRYLRDFTQVATLHCQGFPKGQIRLITHLSDRLIREYLSLYDEYQQTERMTQLLHPEPVDAKKGDN